MRQTGHLSRLLREDEAGVLRAVRLRARWSSLASVLEADPDALAPNAKR